MGSSIGVLRADGCNAKTMVSSEKVVQPKDLSKLLSARTPGAVSSIRSMPRSMDAPPRAASAPMGHPPLPGVIPEDSVPRMHSVNNFRPRGMSVSAEPSSYMKSNPVHIKKIPKTPESVDIITKVLRTNFIFDGLSENQITVVVLAMFKREVKEGEVIIREGAAGDNFYIVESGSFTAFKGGETVFEYDNEGFFGELAVMHDCPRAATVQADTKGVLWAIDRMTFRSIVVAGSKKDRKQKDISIAKMKLFSELRPAQRSAIADCLNRETYADGQHLVREGEALTGDAKLFLVEVGEIHCFKTYQGTRRLVKTIKEGEYFGEVALVEKAPRAADCVAVGEVTVVALGLEAFERVIGPVEDVLKDAVEEYRKVNAAALAACEQI